MAIVASFLLAAPVAPISIGDDARSACETRALADYLRALRRCQLAEPVESDNPNPRLRCYEEAKDEYLRALEGCGCGR